APVTAEFDPASRLEPFARNRPHVRSGSWRGRSGVDAHGRADRVFFSRRSSCRERLRSAGRLETGGDDESRLDLLHELALLEMLEAHLQDLADRIEELEDTGVSLSVRILGHSAQLGEQNGNPLFERAQGLDALTV